MRKAFDSLHLSLINIGAAVDTLHSNTNPIKSKMGNCKLIFTNLTISNLSSPDPRTGCSKKWSASVEHDCDNSALFPLLTVEAGWQEDVPAACSQPDEQCLDEEGLPRLNITRLVRLGTHRIPVPISIS